MFHRGMGLSHSAKKTKRLQEKHIHPLTCIFLFISLIHKITLLPTKKIASKRLTRKAVPCTMKNYKLSKFI